MEQKSIIENSLEKLFEELNGEQPEDSQLKAWTEYPDRSIAIEFLNQRIRKFRVDLRNASVNRLNDEVCDDQCSALALQEIRITNALKILSRFKDNKSAPTIIKLLEVCLGCEYREVFSHCIDALIKIGSGSIDLLLDKYHAYRSKPSEQGVWLEILAKLNKKDDRISQILENHLKVNRYEAIMAMGDYGDKYFVPIIEKIVRASAARLQAKNLDPFQSMVRVWNRDADTYIEARSVLIELKYDVKAGTKDFEKLLIEFDSNMLPHLDAKESYIERMIVAKQELKAMANNGTIFSVKHAELDKELYMKWCLERVLHDLPMDYEISFIIGYIRGLCCLGNNLDLAECVKKLFNGSNIFEDTAHYFETLETFGSVYNYFDDCYSNGELGKNFNGSQDPKNDGPAKGAYLCKEISGFMEGITTAFEKCKGDRGNNRHLHKRLNEFYEWLNLFYENKCRMHYSIPQTSEIQSIKEFESEFHNLILNIASECRQNDQLAV